MLVLAEGAALRSRTCRRRGGIRARDDELDSHAFRSVSCLTRAPDVGCGATSEGSEVRPLPRDSIGLRFLSGGLIHLGPQGIEPRSVVPETTVLSVELQARSGRRLPVGRLDSVCGGPCGCTSRPQCYRYLDGIKIGMDDTSLEIHESPREFLG